MTGWEASGLRTAFTGYFVDQGHTRVASSGLIPHDPRAPLFTNAGMNQFIPYFLGEQAPPFTRATSVQKCARIRGKHDDIDLIGRTTRHLTLFEMLGNFSFGDYFKAEAIAFAWELLTERLGLDPDRLWVTVHEGDDDAERLWRESVGVPAGRIQRMGDDNFWEMGDTGPCGPSSEIYFDRGPSWGEEGGPAHGGEERFVELWNLVFMQFDRQEAGVLVPLPRPNIDTGAGLERLLTVLQDVPSIWETDELRALIARAEELTGRAYTPFEGPGSPAGAKEREASVALRILADHARSTSFLVSDGVFPSNEGRGYVLRRIIRRAVLRAAQLGRGEDALVPLVEAVVETMGEAYPKLLADAGLVARVVAHEEDAFRRTLRAGTALLEEELGRRPSRISGEVAFRLHDTFGFPVDLTTELAGEAGVPLDRAGFEEAMAAQRDRARAAAKGPARAGEATEAFRAVLARFGPTEFTGYRGTEGTGRVLARLAHEGPPPPGWHPGGDQGDGDRPDPVGPPGGSQGPELPEPALFDVVLDATPFYAEGGGQVGDTGRLVAPTGTFRVLDTDRAVEGLTRHVGYLLTGELEEGEEVRAEVDGDRREAIRRNHTGTHLLHWALRSVLGEHVKQQGSLVAPDRLRFDFSHFAPLSGEEIAAVEDLVNGEILGDGAVRVYETSRREAEEAGAMAFFGEKYGEVVRVIEAGSSSVELCGGTHVAALGRIGPFKILSEASIGANTRRIEATTGTRTLEEMRAQDRLLARAAEALRSSPQELPEAAERLAERARQLEEELRRLRSGQLQEEAAKLAAEAGEPGAVAARRDGLDPGELRELALAARALPGVEAVGLVGSPGPGRVALVVAATAESGVDARAVASEAARAVGGGGGGSPQLATAGGRQVEGIEAALELLRSGLRAG